MLSLPECVFFVTLDRNTIGAGDYNRELQGNMSHLLGMDKLSYIVSCCYL